MTNHLKEVEKLTNHLRQVIEDLIEENEVSFDDIAWTVSHGRKHLDKAKRQLEELGEGTKRIDSEADWTRGIAQEMEMPQVDREPPKGKE